MVAPILFLDIDGVLNRKGCFDEIAMSSTFDPECVEILNTVLDRVPSCKIVLSTSWRETLLAGEAMTLRGFEFMLRTHRLHVASRLLSYTTLDERIAKLRGQQIHFWLSVNAPTFWAAVDDTACSSMDLLGSRFVKTDPDVGITAEDADKLVYLLTH